MQVRSRAYRQIAKMALTLGLTATAIAGCASEQNEQPPATATNAAPAASTTPTPTTLLSRIVVNPPAFNHPPVSQASIQAVKQAILALPAPLRKQLDENGAYTWLKAPRWKGNAMEVGPLARMLVGYASGRSDFKDVVTAALGKLKVGPEALFSTLGRTAARGLETQLAVRWLKEEFDNLVANLKSGDTVTADTKLWDPNTWKADTKGYGFTEAPRGALCHWIHIKDKKIENYQIVVPSTWNASPKDAQGKHGAYEAALIGTPMADPKRPVEILRTIHSFDPCLACASHVFSPDGEQLAEVVIR